MTCTSRHPADLLPARPGPEDERAPGGAIRRVLGMKDAGCPEVWAAARERREDPAFGSPVRAEVERR